MRIFIIKHSFIGCQSILQQDLYIHFCMRSNQFFKHFFHSYYTFFSRCAGIKNSHWVPSRNCTESSHCHGAQWSENFTQTNCSVPLMPHDQF